MHISAHEKSLSKLLAFGMFATTIFLVSGSVTDPVNTPKLLILGIFSCAALGLLSATPLRSSFFKNKLILISTILFTLAMFASVIFSHSPLPQNLYGSFGRNNGLICYLFLLFIFIAYLPSRNTKSFDYLLRALLFSGYLNLAYGAWVIAFGDFIGWYNPYKGILGTFGNPDFISAYFGIFFSVCVALLVSKKSSKIYRISMAVVLPLTFFEILKTHAIQGRVVAVLGTGIVGFFLVRVYRNKIWLSAYLLFSLAVGSLALAGALQHGPLVKYIYKVSVSLRGQYWLAAWNTGSSHPVTGVGMDAFGDWYRRTRDIRAITLPGVNTIVNTAHNVWMDMFAFGGWPLLLTYLLILMAPAISIIRILRRSKNYDSIFVGLTVAWIGYQAQSLISINQIGLAIWGWALGGALVAYEVATRTTTDVPTEELKAKGKQGRQRQDNQQGVGVLAAAGGALIGLLIALPPFTADAKLRSAQLSRLLPPLEASMEASYFNPANTTTYLTNIQTLEASGLFDLSHKYALIAVKWNPENFELWKALYSVKNSTSSERATALANMKRLDPLNPDVTSTQ